MLQCEPQIPRPPLRIQIANETNSADMSVSPQLLQNIPLFNELDESEIAEIVGCFTRAEFEPGDRIFREGDRATNACFVLDGELEVLKAQPGGGQIMVAEILPGAMVGEMALVSGGVRMATVQAKRRATVVKVSSSFFHAALEQMSAPAFKILQAIMRVMAGRLGDLHFRILEQWDCEPFDGQAVAATDLPAIEPSFDYLPFLQLLPCFDSFETEEIETILSLGRVFEVPRGAYLIREGAPPGTGYLILRGAVGRSIVRDRRYQLSVSGPGMMSGANAMMSDSSHRSDARALTRTMLLEFDRDTFENIFCMQHPHCLKFQKIVCANQLHQLKAANNLYSVLVCQKKMREITEVNSV